MVDIMSRIASGDYSSNDIGFIRNIAQSLGLENALTGDIDTLATGITEKYNLAFAPEMGLDAYIHSQEGLEIAVANTTEQLEKQGMEFDEHSSLVKRLVAANDKANKNMRSLTDTLEDQMEAFKIGDKNIPEYQQALAKVTAAA